MKYLSTYQHYIVNENSKNDLIPEITQGDKLGIILHIKIRTLKYFQLMMFL